jgi:hypothetical protein
MKMTIQLSSNTYMTLCALLRDALLIPSDASSVLNQAAQELAQIPHHALPADLRQDSKKINALQQAGFAQQNLNAQPFSSMSKMTLRPVA